MTAQVIQLRPLPPIVWQDGDAWLCSTVKGGNTNENTGLGRTREEALASWKWKTRKRNVVPKPKA